MPSKPPTAPPPTASRPRVRPIRSEADLKALALSYLDRFPATTARLKRHLNEKLTRAHAADLAPAPAVTYRWVTNVLDTLTRVRLLDDAAWAEGRAHALFRRGKAQRVITHALALGGAPEAAIDHALAALADDVPDTDFQAALRLARRRNLGPFRPSHLPTADRAALLKTRQRELATLARAGFSFDLARKVLDLPRDQAEDALR